MARPSPAFVHLALITLVAALLILPSLGRTALLDYDESGYAAVALDTARSPDPFTLSIGPKLWFEKPPLYFWLSGLANAAIPDVELASRLPSALSGIAAVALVWLILFALTSDASSASFGALLLLTSAAFIDISRQGRVDTLVIASTLLLIYAWIRSLTDARWLYLAGAALAIGVMTKDVVALFVLPMLALWLVLSRRFDLLRTAQFWRAALLFLALVLPWHVYETVRFGATFWKTYLLTHVFARYETNLLATNESDTVYVRYLAYYAPWLCALFLAALAWCAVFWKKLAPATKREFISFAFGAVFVLGIFFTARTKVVYYLPFALSFMAIAVGFAAAQLEFKGKKYVLALIFLMSLATGLHAYAHPEPDLAYARRVAEDERIIGLMLRPTAATVYFTAPAYWETVRFYSGEKVLEAWNPSVPEPAYVVVHRGYEAPLATTTKTELYKGGEVSLYRVP